MHTDKVANLSYPHALYLVLVLDKKKFDAHNSNNCAQTNLNAN